MYTIATCTYVRIRQVHANSIQMVCHTAVQMLCSLYMIYLYQHHITRMYICILFYLFHLTSLPAMKVEVEKRNGSEFEVELDSVMVSVGAEDDTGTLK